MEYHRVHTHFVLISRRKHPGFSIVRSFFLVALTALTHVRGVVYSNGGAKIVFLRKYHGAYSSRRIARRIIPLTLVFY
jgi:hypothetical protein